MITKSQIETKFSRHIGRILTKIEAFDPIQSYDYQKSFDDVRDFTKGELWLLCNDLILMLGLSEGEKDDTEETNNR